MALLKGLLAGTGAAAGSCKVLAWRECREGHTGQARGVCPGCLSQSCSSLLPPVVQLPVVWVEVTLLPAPGLGPDWSQPTHVISFSRRFSMVQRRRFLCPAACRRWLDLACENLLCGSLCNCVVTLVA